MLVADRPDPEPLTRPESPRLLLRLAQVLVKLADLRRAEHRVEEAEALEGEAAVYRFFAGVD